MLVTRKHAPTDPLLMTAEAEHTGTTALVIQLAWLILPESELVNKNTLIKYARSAIIK